MIRATITAVKAEARRVFLARAAVEVVRDRYHWRCRVLVSRDARHNRFGLDVPAFTKQGALDDALELLRELSRPAADSCEACGDVLEPERPRCERHVHTEPDEIHCLSAGCAREGCPLASKPVAKLELWSPPLRWMSEQPSSPGWYWRLFAGTAQCVLVTLSQGCLVVNDAHGFWSISSKPDERVMWAGPLVPPETP